MNSENKAIPEEYLHTQNQETNELKPIEKKDFYKNVSLELLRNEIDTTKVYTPELKNYHSDYFAEKAKDFGIDNLDTNNDGWEDALMQKMLAEYAEAVTIDMSSKKPNSSQETLKSLVFYKDSEFLIEDLDDSIYEKKNGKIVKHENPGKFGNLETSIEFVLSKEGYEKITGKPYIHDESFPTLGKEVPILGTMFSGDKVIHLRIGDIRPTAFRDKDLQERIKAKWNLTE